MERTVDNPNWEFIDLTDQSDSDYGEVTEYVLQHKEKMVALRIGQSEGGHIMECDRGMWQVDIGSSDDYSYGTKCFENRTDAIDNAIAWVESL
jgi:hypothetical protein